MGTMKERQREVQLYRGQIPSPGRPTVAWRQDRVAFWAEIAKGEKTDDAAVAAGVSSPVGYRWFRHAGGVNPCLPSTVSGRYLSFAEREEIALFGTPQSRAGRLRAVPAQYVRNLATKHLHRLCRSEQVEQAAAVDVSAQTGRRFVTRRSHGSPGSASRP